MPFDRGGARSEALIKGSKPEPRKLPSARPNGRGTAFRQVGFELPRQPFKRQKCITKSWPEVLRTVVDLFFGRAFTLPFGLILSQLVIPGPIRRCLGYDKKAAVQMANGPLLSTEPLQLLSFT